MDERSYPQEVDYSWLASDRYGHLGVFMTSGRGPVPMQALSEAYPLDGIEEQILTLPAASDTDLRIRTPQRDRFVALAERGFFVYDWSDVHRTEAYIDEYELIALPYRPLTLDQLPDDFADLAHSIRFTKVAFANAWRVDVRAHIICREASS